MRPPSAEGLRPRRVVSTSGSSGKRLVSAPLLDLRLFVVDVLARQRVELAHFQLVGVQALVLGGHVEVAGSGRGQQLDLLAHGGSCLAASLELVPLGAQLGDDLVDAPLLDGAHAAGGQPQSHPALFRLDPEALRVQVGQKAPTRLVVGVGDSVPDTRLLASDFANAGHTLTLMRVPHRSRAGLYTSPPWRSQGGLAAAVQGCRRAPLSVGTAHWAGACCWGRNAGSCPDRPPRYDSPASRSRSLSAQSWSRSGRSRRRPEEGDRAPAATRSRTQPRLPK